MSTIGGPGGIGGPKGPGGPAGPGGPEGAEGTDAVADVGDVHDVADVGDIRGASGASGAAGAAGTSDVDALAADVAAGKITRREAVDQLVESMAGPELGAGDRAELRELLSDLVDSDPYLGSLVGRI